MHLLHADAPTPWAVLWQDSAGVNFDGITNLHDDVMFYLLVILGGIGYLIMATVWRFDRSTQGFPHKHLQHGTGIELIWTLTPGFIILIIAMPSFELLYLLDEGAEEAMIFRAMGNQWFWSYAYPDHISLGEALEFDSYAVPLADLEEGQFRLLDVDQPLVLPEQTHCKYLVSSQDVIHNFAVPALGLKMDAYPGRLNSGTFYLGRAGRLYGQCSELCGSLHSAMPIVIDSVSTERFLEFLLSQLE